MEEGPWKGLATLKSLVNPSAVWLCSQPNLESQLSLPPQWTRQDWWELVDREWCPRGASEMHAWGGRYRALGTFPPLLSCPLFPDLTHWTQGRLTTPLSSCCCPCVFRGRNRIAEKPSSLSTWPRSHRGDIQQFLPLPQQLVHSAFQSSSD